MSFEPWQGGKSGQPVQHPQMSMMRASHADRERAVDVLKAGFAEGRLSQGEYEQRMGRAYQAQTHGQLQAIVADLPAGPVPQLPQLQPVQQAQQVVPQTFMPAPVPPRTNGSATGALVCGILAPMTWGLTAIPAVVLGHKARNEIRRTGESGDGFAVAGVVLGWMSIAFWVFIAMVVVAASG